MSFVDLDSNNMSSTPGEHLTANMVLATTEETTLLKSVTPFAAWYEAGAITSLPYSDVTSWALEVGYLDKDMDQSQWVSTYIKAAAVAGVFATAFKHVDKNSPFVSEAEFIAALRTAADKVPASEQDSLRFSQENLEEGEGTSGDMVDVGQWELHITWGQLRKSGVGARAAAWLERSTRVGRCYEQHNEALQLLLDAAVENKYVDLGPEDNLTPDATLAFSALRWLANFVVTGPELRLYFPPEDGGGRLENAREEARFAKDAHRGDSTFAQARTMSMVAVKAKVIKAITTGAEGSHALNGYLLDIAAACLAEQFATPARVFCCTGISMLERAAEPYEAWSAEPEVMAMPVATRVGAFCTRARGNARAAPLGASVGAGEPPAAAGATGTTVPTISPGFTKALTAARERGDNPSIFRSIGKLMRPGQEHDPLDVLFILFTGKDAENPDRQPTGLSQCAAAHCEASCPHRGPRTHARCRTVPASCGPPSTCPRRDASPPSGTAAAPPVEAHSRPAILISGVSSFRASVHIPHYGGVSCA